MRSQLIIAHGDRLLGHRQCDRFHLDSIASSCYFDERIWNPAWAKC